MNRCLLMTVISSGLFFSGAFPMMKRHGEALGEEPEIKRSRVSLWDQLKDLIVDSEEKSAENKSFLLSVVRLTAEYSYKNIESRVVHERESLGDYLDCKTTQVIQESTVKAYLSYIERIYFLLVEKNQNIANEFIQKALDIHKDLLGTDCLDLKPEDKEILQKNEAQVTLHDTEQKEEIFNNIDQEFFPKLNHANKQELNLVVKMVSGGVRAKRDWKMIQQMIKSAYKKNLETKGDISSLTEADKKEIWSKANSSAKIEYILKNVHAEQEEDPEMVIHRKESLINALNQRAKMSWQERVDAANGIYAQSKICASRRSIVGKSVSFTDTARVIIDDKCVEIAAVNFNELRPKLKSKDESKELKSKKEFENQE